MMLLSIIETSMLHLRPECSLGTWLGHEKGGNSSPTLECGLSFMFNGSSHQVIYALQLMRSVIAGKAQSFDVHQDVPGSTWTYYHMDTGTCEI